MNNYTAIIKQDGDWWIGWIEEVPGVNGQEKKQVKISRIFKTDID